MKKQKGRVVQITLEQWIRRIPLPKGLFWMEDASLVKYRQSRHITAQVAFLYTQRKGGGIYYSPLLIGWRGHKQSGVALDERVRQHIVQFQTALKLGTAPYAEAGGVLDLRPPEVPRDARTNAG